MRHLTVFFKKKEQVFINITHKNICFLYYERLYCQSGTFERLKKNSNDF